MTRDNPRRKPLRRLGRALAPVAVIALAAGTGRGSTLDLAICAVLGGLVLVAVGWQLWRWFTWDWALEREARRPIEKITALEEKRQRKAEAGGEAA
jgi:hypothetical protein